MSHDIFISYSRCDRAAVQPIKEELEAAGFSCWMGRRGIESGSEEFTDSLVDAIGASTVLLFFLSESSQKSDWSLKEIHFAERKRKRVIIVRFNDDPLTDSFAYEFGRADIVDWRVPEQKQKLLRELRAWTGVAEPVSRKCCTEPVAVPPQTGVWDVFISHSSEDKEVVRRYVAALRDAGISYWLDSESIPRGASYPKEIMRGIEGSSIFLLLYSANVAAKSEDVLNEIENAKKMQKEMIPVRLDRTEYTPEFQYYLSRIQWIDAAERDESAVFEEMVKNIRLRMMELRKAKPY